MGWRKQAQLVGPWEGHGVLQMTQPVIPNLSKPTLPLLRSIQNMPPLPTIPTLPPHPTTLAATCNPPHCQPPSLQFLSQPPSFHSLESGIMSAFPSSLLSKCLAVSTCLPHNAQFSSTLRPLFPLLLKLVLSNCQPNAFIYLGILLFQSFLNALVSVHGWVWQA
ncbi:hypothetical protein VNO77_05215 [Canavalia gladiata]|uniref:Uncharacterized protein n=1 Tax=Canavalia gladiata TaxID=3824 RepID=A0AAN9MZZ4_CANGL